MKDFIIPSMGLSALLLRLAVHLCSPNYSLRITETGERVGGLLDGKFEEAVNPSVTVWPQENIEESKRDKQDLNLRGSSGVCRTWKQLLVI